jgi:tetratricopeptide (TPR) repeat protein
MEAFHHYVQAGETGFLTDGSHQVRALFTEQLDAFGRALSLARRRLDAASVYERAVARDGGDWYAHHYLAFNLDWEGVQAERVEEHYRLALQIHGQHVWHHGRLACFYVTRGRMGRAREAWREALDVLEDRARENERLYQELHRPFARLLLHRGELELARKVLDGVPPRMREGLAWWGALDALHASLADAERDQAVFPPHIAVEARWHGPHLLPQAQRAEVQRWLPGRVAAVDSEAISIRVANGPSEFGWYDRSVVEVAREWKGSATAMSAGTYVEIVTWDSGAEEILVHPPAQPEPALPRLLPPPDRYLRARLRRNGAS